MPLLVRVLLQVKENLLRGERVEMVPNTMVLAVLANGMHPFDALKSQLSTSERGLTDPRVDTSSWNGTL